MVQKQSLLKITLLLAASLTVMSGATIAPSLPAIKAMFSDVPNIALLTRLVLTVPALFIALSGPLFGALINRFGRLNLLYISLVLYAFAGSTGLWMDSLYHILIGRALLGVAVGGIMTICSTLVGDYFDGEERSKFTGMQGVFMSIGGVVFVGAGGLLADINWRFPFAIYLFSIIVIVLVAIALNEPKTDSDSVEKDRNKTVELPYKTIGVILTTMFIGMLIFYMIPVQIPFLLVERGTETASLSGFAIAFSTVGGAIGASFYAYLKRKFTYQNLFSIIFITLAVGYIIIGLGITFTVTIIGLFVSGLGVGLLMPNATLWLLEITPLAKRGAIMGFFTSALYIGQFASPLLSQPITNKVGLGSTFVILAIVSGILGAIFLFYTKNSHNTVTSENRQENLGNA